MAGFPRLREGPRQILAVGVGVGAFAAVYFGLGLVFVISAVVAAVGYGSTLWTVRTLPRLDQQALVEGSRLTKADLENALDEISLAQEALSRASERATADGHDGIAGRIDALDRQLDRLAKMLNDDPSHLNSLRQLLGGLLGRVAKAILHAAETDALGRADVDTALATVESRVTQIVSRRADARADAAEDDLEILASQLNRQL